MSFSFHFDFGRHLKDGGAGKGAVEFYLTECTDGLVLESQLPHKKRQPIVYHY